MSPGFPLSFFFSSSRAFLSAPCNQSEQCLQTSYTFGLVSAITDLRGPPNHRSFWNDLLVMKIPFSWYLESLHERGCLQPDHS